MYGVVYTTEMNVSAYCWQDTSSMTASGRSAHISRGCAAGPSIPFGSIVIVHDGPWKGRYTVDDRGGAITNRHIDLRLKDHDTCIKFGRRSLTVTVRPGNGISSRGKVRRQEARIVHPVAAPPNPYRISETRQAPAIEPEAGGRIASALIGGLCACAASAGAMCLTLGRRLKQ